MATSRSLQANQNGIKQIQKALTNQQWGHEDLKEKAQVAKSTAINFCTGKPVDRKNFARFCELLGLDWQVISGDPTEVQSEASQSIDIDTFVQSLRAQARTDIQKRCGTMRVLDMTTPIDASAIYTDVNILEKVTGKTRAEIDQLMQGCQPENFDRFFLGNVRHKRVDGLKAIERHNLLMILGRPGAGKTTFLKHLAMLCSVGERFAERVPVFVTLKEFADTINQPGLVNSIAASFAPQFGLEDCRRLLESGRGLLLLDGLDEVQEKDHDRVLKEIRDFARRYGQNIIIITCRIAAREYIFEQFTDVEVADFNPQQIEDFVTKWFQLKNRQQATLFLERLKTSEPVQELATNPLLLTLLCLEFEEASDFPASRAELYQRGLNVLLTKWDGQRGIKRDVVYKKLSTKRKESLLGQLAMYTFESGDYFFKHVIAEQRISQYLQNLPDASTDLEALLVDSHAVLKSIEAQHGLLVERATGIYSFSHLTFHEYFVAKHLIERSDREAMLHQLLKNSVEKRWREVFLLVAEQLEIADTLLQGLKTTIDEILKDDNRLQSYLTWVNAKSASVQKYKSTVARDYYFVLGAPFLVKKIFSHSLDNSYQDYLPLRSNLSRTLSLSVDLSLTLSGETSCNLEEACSLSMILDHELGINDTKNHSLTKQIQLLQNKLPDTSNHQQFQSWWQSKGKNWTKQLRQFMINYFDIGHDWKFTEKQKQKLQQYYNANKLLVDCLNSECYISRSVREEIEATLLLPITEIER
jgi:predicted NACHT family NTPase